MSQSRWRITITDAHGTAYVYDRWEPDQARANLSALTQFYAEHPAYAARPVQIDSKPVHQ